MQYLKKHCSADDELFHGDVKHIQSIMDIHAG